MPYEILNKKFRSGQKNIDREVSRVQQASSEVEECLQDQKSPSVQQVSLALDNMVEKLCFLKRKVINVLSVINRSVCLLALLCRSHILCTVRLKTWWAWWVWKPKIRSLRSYLRVYSYIVLKLCPDHTLKTSMQRTTKLGQLMHLIAEHCW